jgi:hypothetical protein
MKAAQPADLNSYYSFIYYTTRPQNRGTEGPITPQVVFPPIKEAEMFVEACENMGIPRVFDYNGPTQVNEF